MTKAKPPAPSKEKTGYKIFAASTYRDNRARRKLVQDAISMADMLSQAMEVYTASTRPAV